MLILDKSLLFYLLSKVNAPSMIGSYVQLSSSIAQHNKIKNKNKNS
jgi:hypothetical protein